MKSLSIWLKMVAVAGVALFAHTAVAGEYDDGLSSAYYQKLQ
jgi:hypothetical protein